MLKAIAKPLTLALALATFGTGCDFADIGEAIDDFFSNGGEVIIEPGVPEPVDPWLECELALDDCLGGGMSYADADADYDVMPYPYDEVCFEEFDLCIGDIEPEPPVEPPVGECEEELEICLDSIYGNGPTMDLYLPYPDEEACWSAYDTCLGVEPPPPSPCDDAFQDCLLTDQDPAFCELEYLECWGIDDPYLQCDVDLQYCLLDGNEPESCFQEHSVCIESIEPTGPDACDQLYSDCVYNGVDEQLCQEVWYQCSQNQPYPCEGDEPEPGSEEPVDIDID